jgi:hypothetical protein
MVKKPKNHCIVHLYVQRRKAVASKSNGLVRNTLLPPLIPRGLVVFGKHKVVDGAVLACDAV